MDATDVAIRLAASDFLGWRYRGAGQNPKVPPGPLAPAVVVSRAAIDCTDCTTFTASVLTRAFLTARWSSAAWANLEIMDGARPWSPIEEVVAAGIGREVSSPVDGRWHIVQRWSGLDAAGRVCASSHGHSVLYLGASRLLQASSLALPGDTVGRVGWTDRPFVEHARGYVVRVAVLGGDA